MGNEGSYFVSHMVIQEASYNAKKLFHHKVLAESSRSPPVLQNQSRSIDLQTYFPVIPLYHLR